MPGRSPAAGSKAWPHFELKTKPCPKLARERLGNRHTRIGDKAGRLLERRATDAGLIGGTEIRTIGQVESLEEQVHFRPFVNLHGLGETRVELHERVAAQVTERNLVAGAARQAGLQCC